MEEHKDTSIELVNSIRLSLTTGTDDVRLYTAKLVRKYRNQSPELAKKLENLLKETNSARSFIRKNTLHSDSQNDTSLPSDEKTQMSILKFISVEEPIDKPLYSNKVDLSINSILNERKKADLLLKNDLQPTRSAIFTGKPGLGKTITAQWLAQQLDLPFLVLDLTTVMSSYLGKTGANLRAALDYAKTNKCVLLLDEIDSIAKKRGDSGDVGELKRLVTVILQEIENWPNKSLLLAATNHPELLDPAIWRRFDHIIEFEMPDADLRKSAIKLFLNKDFKKLTKWVDLLAFMYKGLSLSEIERTIIQIRRTLLLSETPIEDVITENIRHMILRNDLDKKELKKHLVELISKKKISQRKASEISGISRDTLRKETLTLS